MDFKIYRHTSPVTETADGSVVAIGNFDGLHLGHRAVLEAAKTEAKKLNVPLCVVTFEPHPRTVFGMEVPRLTPFDEKAQSMREVGAQLVYAIRFTKDYAKTSAEEFVNDTLVETLNTKHVFIGEDFGFGKNRSGNPESLTEMGGNKGFSVTAVPEVLCEDGIKLASSRVRDLLKEGKLDEANAFLGRPYEIRTHLHEDEMLNLVGDISGYAPLKNGVYWTKFIYNDSSDGQGEDGDHPDVLMCAVVNGKVKFPPVNERPGTPKHTVTLQFVNVFELK